MQKMWLVSTLSNRECDLLKVFNAIDIIDWSRDEVLVYNSRPDILRSSLLLDEHFKQRSGSPMTIRQYNRFVLDKRSSLNFDLK